MSGGVSASVIAAGITAAAGVGTALYSANQQRKAQDAQTAQAANAAAAAKTAPGTQASSGPNTSALSGAGGDNANSGSAATTLLTGAAGVDPTQLNLGKNNLGGSGTANQLGTSTLLGS